MLKINCCGHERTSSYCPDCGKKLEHPLESLYRHLDGIVKIDSAKLQTVKKDVAMQKKNPEIHKRRIARIQKTFNKWLDWRNSVRVAMGGPEIPITDEREAENAALGVEAELEGKKAEKPEAAEKKK